MRATLAALATGLALAACSGKPPAPRPTPDRSGTETARPAGRDSIAALKEVVRGDAAPGERAGTGGGMPPGHPPTGTVAPQPGPSGPVTVADVRLTTPSTWLSEQPNSSMRQAQYRIPGDPGPGEAVVYFFGANQGGGVEANIARWLGQITPPAGAAPAAGASEHREIGGIRVTLIRAAGTYNPGMTMGAETGPLAGWALVGIILESPGGPVFVKITGPEATVEAARKSIDEFVASLALAH